MATCLWDDCNMVTTCPPGAVESHQVREGTCSTLLDLVNSKLWPPTLRDMAAGHLQFLMVRRCSQLEQCWLHDTCQCQTHTADP